MTTRETRYHFYADITLKAYAGGATTTYRLSDRPYHYRTYDSVPSYPILKQITPISVSMGAFISDGFNGTLEIDNSENSFSAERRFSDLFEREAIIQAPVSLYYATEDPSGAILGPSFTLFSKGFITNWSLNPQAQTLSLEMTSNVIKRGTVGRVIEQTVSSGIVSDGAVPPGSLGIVLPMVFGDLVEVRGYLYEDQSSTGGSLPTSTGVQAIFAVAANYGIGFFYEQNENVDFYARSVRGEFTLCNGAPSGPIAGAWNDGNGGSTTVNEGAQRIDVGSTENYLVHGGTFTLIDFYGGKSPPDPVGELIVELWEANEDDVPKYRLDRTVIDADLISWANDSSDLEIEFHWTRAHPIDPNKIYYFSLDQRLEVGGTPTSLTWKQDTSYSTHYYSIAEDGTPTIMNDGVRANLFELWGCSAVTSSTGGTLDDRGFGIWTVSVLCLYQTGNAVNIPADISTLEYVFLFPGLQDLLGTIIGAGERLKNPINILELLTTNWDYESDDYFTSRFDPNLYSDSHAQLETGAPYFREVTGFTVGLQTFDSVISDICRNMAIRIGAVPSATTGKYFGAWAWGGTEEIQAVFDNENSRVTDITGLGTETVVNSVEIIYGETLINRDFLKTQSQGRVSGFTSVKRAVNEGSISVFDSRLLADSFHRFIGESDSADSLSEYYLRRFSQPSIQVTIEAPFDGHESLKVLDVIEIVNSDLSAYFGTTPEATPPTHEYGETDLKEGDYMTRAQRYRAQIESLRFQLSPGDFPLVIIVATLLTNGGDPT